MLAHFLLGTHRILSSTPDEVQGTVADKVWRTFTDTFQESLLFSTQGMMGDFAKIAPHRLYRGLEGALLLPGHSAHCASVRVVIRTAGMKFSKCRRLVRLSLL